MACSSNTHGCSNMQGGGDMHGCRQYARWQQQHTWPQTTHTARSSNFTAARPTAGVFIFSFSFFHQLFFFYYMTVLWAQERHARPTVAMHTATDDTHGGGGNMHSCGRHPQWWQQHSRPQMTRTAAATFMATDNAHGSGGDMCSPQQQHAQLQQLAWRR